MASALQMTCPECGDTFAPTHHRQQFCTPAHKAAFNNRQTTQGAPLTALAKAWRAGRNSKDPKRKAAAAFALNRLCRMVDAINAEDRAAGRLDAIAMLERRQAAGLID